MILEEKEKYMDLALNVAEDGLKNGELPIGAVVVLNDKVIAKSYTKEKTEGRYLVHADFLALEKADKLTPFPGKRSDAKLFVNLEPCMMCLGAAMSFFIGEVYYGLSSPSDGAVSMAISWKRREEDFPGYKLPKIHGQIFEEETRKLFRKYVEIHKKGTMVDWARSFLK